MTIVLELNGVVCIIPEFVYIMSPSFPLRHSSLNNLCGNISDIKSHLDPRKYVKLGFDMEEFVY